MLSLGVQNVFPEQKLQKQFKTGKKKQDLNLGEIGASKVYMIYVDA